MKKGIILGITLEREVYPIFPQIPHRRFPRDKEEFTFRRRASSFSTKPIMITKRFKNNLTRRYGNVGKVSSKRFI